MDNNPIKKVCGHYVLVKKEHIEEKTAGGIVLPSQTISNERARQCVATVVEFGPKAFHGYVEGTECHGPEDWGVQVGDKIEFCRSYGQTPLSDESEEFLIIIDKDIMVVV